MGKISKKDQKLLIYLGSVIILAAAYFFGAKSFIEKQSQLSTEVEELQGRVDHLNEIYVNREDYENRTANAQVEYNETIDKFFGGLDQDNSLMLMKDLEEKSDAWISRVSFQGAEIVVGNSEGSENQVEGENTENVSAEALSGYKQNLNIDYAASYDNFKRFVEYIQNYDQRLFISNLSATYSEDSGLVAGSIVLTQYALKGTGKEYLNPDMSNVETGVTNIFSTLNDDRLAFEEELRMLELEDALLNSENSENTENSEGSESTENSEGNESDSNDNSSEDNTENNENEQLDDSDNSSSNKKQPKTPGII